MITISRFTSNFLKNIVAGAIISSLMIGFSFSSVVMIFSQSLFHYVSIGISFCFISLMIGSIYSSWKSSFPFAIVIIRSIALAPIATVVIKTSNHLLAIHQPQAILPTTMTIIAITSILSGVVSYSIGYFKKGNIVRYIPYPVLGGFLSASGFILIKLGYFLLSESFNAKNGINFSYILLVVIAFLYALLLFIIHQKKINNIFFPLSFLFLIGLTHIIQNFLPIPIKNDIHMHWFFHIQVYSFHNILALNFFENIRWFLILANWSAIITSIILFIILHLLHIIILEDGTNYKVDLNKELKITGISNFFSGLVGGIPHGLAAHFSLFSIKFGGNTRICGITTSIFSALALFYGSEVLTYIPRFILAGFLFYMSISIIYEWIILSWRRLPFFDYLQIIIIVIAMFGINFLSGLLFGIVFSCIKFIYQASCLNPIKLSLSGENYTSNIIRSPSEQQRLHHLASSIFILKLQGILFFGTANQLFINIINHLEDNKNIKYLILDFTLVISIDTSARTIFLKLQKDLKKRGVFLILINLNQIVKTELILEQLHEKVHIKLFNLLDDALQWCEQQLLGPHAVEDEALFQQELFNWFGSKPMVIKFLTYLQPLVIDKDQLIILQGSSDFDKLYLLKSGKLTVTLSSTENKNELNIGTIMPGAIVGEMSFFAYEPRSASIKALTLCEVYCLTQSNYKMMQKRDPELSAKFIQKVIELISARLRHTNAQIKSLNQ